MNLTNIKSKINKSEQKNRSFSAQPANLIVASSKDVKIRKKYTAASLIKQEKNYHSVTNNQYLSVYIKSFDCKEDYIRCVLAKQSDNVLSIYSALIRRARYHKHVFPSYETLREETGLSESTIKRAVNTLVNAGILKKFYHHMQTLSFQLPYVLKEKNFLRTLAPWLAVASNIAWSSLMLSMVVNAYQSYGTKFDLLMNNGVIYNQGIQSSVRESAKHACYARPEKNNAARPEFVTIFTRIKKKLKGKQLKRTFPTYVDAITCLDLTDLGKAKISAFPEAAIKYAQANFSNTSNKKNPFKAFITICEQWCLAHEAKPLWSVFYEYKRAYNLDDTQGYLKSIPKVSQKGERVKSPTSTAISFDEHHEKRKCAEERLAKVDEQQRAEAKKHARAPLSPEQQRRAEEFLAILGIKKPTSAVSDIPAPTPEATSTWGDGQPLQQPLFDFEDQDDVY